MREKLTPIFSTLIILFLTVGGIFPYIPVAPVVIWLCWKEIPNKKKFLLWQIPSIIVAIIFEVGKYLP